MDIRTKLILALVTASLISMAVLGGFAYNAISETAERMTLRQLDAVASTKTRDLERLLDRVQPSPSLTGDDLSCPMSSI